MTFEHNWTLTAFKSLSSDANQQKLMTSVCQRSGSRGAADKPSSATRADEKISGATRADDELRGATRADEELCGATGAE